MAGRNSKGRKGNGCLCIRCSDSSKRWSTSTECNDMAGDSVGAGAKLGRGRVGYWDTERGFSATQCGQGKGAVRSVGRGYHTHGRERCICSRSHGIYNAMLWPFSGVSFLDESTMSLLMTVCAILHCPSRIHCFQLSRRYDTPTILVDRSSWRQAPREVNDSAWN